MDNAQGSRNAVRLGRHTKFLVDRLCSITDIRHVAQWLYPATVPICGLQMTWPDNGTSLSPKTDHQRRVAHALQRLAEEVRGTLLKFYNPHDCC